jgi:hypothetical protein
MANGDPGDQLGLDSGAGGKLRYLGPPIPASAWEGNSGGTVTETSLGGSTPGFSPWLGLGAFGQGVSQPPSGEAATSGSSVLPLIVLLALLGGGYLWWRSRA